jgi:hypothetical protein
MTATHPRDMPSNLACHKLSHECIRVNHERNLLVFGGHGVLEIYPMYTIHRMNENVHPQ